MHFHKKNILLESCVVVNFVKRAVTVHDRCIPLTTITSKTCNAGAVLRSLSLRAGKLWEIHATENSRYAHVARSSTPSKSIPLV